MIFEYAFGGIVSSLTLCIRPHTAIRNLLFLAPETHLVVDLSDMGS